MIVLLHLRVTMHKKVAKFTKRNKNLYIYYAHHSIAAYSNNNCCAISLLNDQKTKWIKSSDYMGQIKDPPISMRTNKIFLYILIKCVTEILLYTNTTENGQYFDSKSYFFSSTFTVTYTKKLIVKKQMRFRLAIKRTSYNVFFFKYPYSIASKVKKMRISHILIYGLNHTICVEFL